MEAEEEQVDHSQSTVSEILAANNSDYESASDYACDSSSVIPVVFNGSSISVNSSGGTVSGSKLTITGGTLIVNGPTDNGNGPLGYNGTFNVTGETVLAVGRSGMAMIRGSSSTQYSVHY